MLKQNGTVGKQLNCKAVYTIDAMVVKSRKRLLLIGNTLETFGGGEKWLLETASLLNDKYDITILNPISRKSLIRVSKTKILKSYNLGGVRILDLSSLGISWRAFGTESFLLMAPSLGSVAALKDCVRNADIIYCLSSNPIFLGAITYAAHLYSKRLIFGVHNPSFYKLFEKQADIKQKAMNRAYRALLRRVTYFHVLNSDDEKLIEANYPNAKVFRIPNFITNKPRTINVNKKRFIALFIARFQKYQKGIDLLGQIIQKTANEKNDIEFHLIGKGGDGEEAIRVLAREYPKVVKRLGFISESRLGKEYANANVLLFPSRFEGFPLTILEAQTYGLPVIAFDVRGSNEILRSDLQGTLIKPFDINAFVAKFLDLYYLWDKDSAAYLYRKKKISRFVQKKYSSHVVLDGITKMFDF